MNARRYSSLFWLALSVVVCTAAFNLGLGSFTNPGMGFMSFGAAALLGVFSIIRVAQSAKGGELRLSDLFRGTLWHRVALVTAALFVYAEVITPLGYLLATFLLMTFLFWIVQRKRVWAVLLTSLLTTVVTYYVFSKWLNCQFPPGLFGF